jgi:hypothetical protein
MTPETVKTIADMIARKTEFLANPGCDIDYDSIETNVGVEGSDADLAAIWFDKIVETLTVFDEITLYRHMTVPDVANFAAGLDDGSLKPGDHWSLSEATWSPSPEQSDRHVRLTGTICREQIEVFSTFQCLFAHPWEEEIVFSGDISLTCMIDLEEGNMYDFDASKKGLPF